jgi:plasmid stabilization system protein ParE
VTGEVWFESEARAELRQVVLWYEERTSGLGEEFLTEVEACLARVNQMPAACADVRGAPDVRRALLQRFPYAIVFLAGDSAVKVLTVAHGRRRPLYWRARGSER